jgi:endonuclease YncB( thermonuclease family)
LKSLAKEDRYSIILPCSDTDVQELAVSTISHPFQRWRIKRQIWRFNRWYRRVHMSRWLAGLLVLAAVGLGSLVPAPQASRMAAWLKDTSALGVAVLRPGDRSDDPNMVLRPQRATGAGFRLCAERRQANCVIDGDTIRYGGVKIRIADIDTPEVFSPKCASEAALGERATERLLELLNAGPIELVPIDRDADRYGPKLRVIERHGRSLGQTLVAEGLARRWDGARRSWCG